MKLASPESLRSICANPDMPLGGVSFAKAKQVPRLTTLCFRIGRMLLCIFDYRDWGVPRAGGSGLRHRGIVLSRGSVNERLAVAELPTAATPQLARQVKCRIMKCPHHLRLLELACHEIFVKFGAKAERRDWKKTCGPWKSKSGRTALRRTDIGTCDHSKRLSDLASDHRAF